ncbi:hypothetical protein CTR2_R29830 [Comamonas thiooxydans]|uniref:putative phage abortive infection protein n=1 Tax=Comamonas thiooxydans TaxID=363952 RepID=UPI0021FE7913|nr:putative phage abortive infection protein [Comamonas thiooxydans]BDR09645.1 hypothetical protein CTR2_R29830 [Comamonas thiooxydans]
MTLWSVREPVALCDCQSAALQHSDTSCVCSPAMEEIAFMPFIFWAGLVFLLGSALCVHFDVFSFRKRLTRKFYSAFSFVIPSKDIRGQRLKFGMAAAAAYIFAVILLLLLFSILFSTAMPYATGSEENKYTGPLGDLFNGVLTPVLTFLTFCGLLVTILIQNVQMQATLQELELTRKEMSDSTDALQAQVVNSIAQKFDGNFYEMLKFHKNLSEKLYDEERIINFELRGFNDDPLGWSGFSKVDYFRGFFLTNYQLLKFIKDNEKKNIISYEEAKNYANIARAMIPERLLALIFINCLNARYVNYKNLVEYYEFLEHFSFSNFNDSCVLNKISEYDRKAFGNFENLLNFISSEKSHLLYFIGLDIKDFINELRSKIHSVFKLSDYHEMMKNPEVMEYSRSIYKFVENINEIKNGIELRNFLDEKYFLMAIESKDQIFFLKYSGFNIKEYYLSIQNINSKLKELTPSAYYGVEEHLKYLDKVMY